MDEYEVTINPSEIPKSLMDNPYQTILEWSERRFKHIGERLFAFIALMPHSIFIPEIDYEDTSFKCNLSVLFLSPAGGCKTLVGKAVEEISINPVSFEDITSAQFQSELQGKNCITIITGDAGRIFKDFDLIKAIEGIISDSRVSRRTKRERLDYNIVGNSFMAGVPQDLTSYLSSGYLSRFIPISILHKREEQDKIGKAIVDSLGRKSNGNGEEVTLGDIKNYYKFLWQIQQGQQEKNGYAPIVGYLFLPEFKSQIYNMWKNYRHKADSLEFTNYYRELISGFKYLFCSAFLNIAHREVRDGLLVPTQDDLKLALILQQRELKTKIHLLRNRKVARNIDDIRYLEKVSKELKINDVNMEMLRIFASDKEIKKI